MRVIGLALCLACLASCGDDAVVVDAAVDAAPRCNTVMPFGPPELVAELNSDFDDVSPRFYPDELGVVFGRRGAAGIDLWTATRATQTDPWGTPSLITSVNSVSSDVWPSQSSDGLTLIFDADRTTPNTFRIWMSTRQSVMSPFGPPMLRPELMNNEFHGLLANDRSLYFASTSRPGIGGSDIWRADVSVTNTIGAPVALVGGVNTIDNEDAPSVTQDERTIYFRRTIGMAPNTEADVYTASRSTPQDGFGPSMKIETLSMVGINEAPSWVSPDGCNLYGFFNAPGGPGGLNIFVARRPL